MRSIIEELYDCFPDVNCYSTPERRAVSEEYHALGQKITDAFGLDFLDRFVQLGEERLGYQGEDHFAAGLRLGVRLMVEVFTSATG